MSLSFKRTYYGARKILNRQKANELIRKAYLDEPYTIFEDWFRYISIEENGMIRTLTNVEKPFPDLLICQKPNSKFALHLSGGVDSALLAFLYQNEEADYLVCTVEGGSEIEYITAKEFFETAKLKGRLHHIVVSKEDAFNVASEILPHLKEPLMDPAFVLSFIVSKKAKELGHDLVISGDGADVAFGLSPFGRGNLRTLVIWKTIEPAEMLGMKALLPYSLPALQIWAENYVTNEQRKNKILLRNFAKSIGIPQIVIESKKQGWVGHAAWCVGEVYTRMQHEINNSPFLGILDEGVNHGLKGKIFRQYSLIKWLEHNFDNEIISTKQTARIISSTANTNTKYKPWTLLWILQKCLLCIKERRLPDIVKKLISSLKRIKYLKE